MFLVTGATLPSAAGLRYLQVYVTGFEVKGNSTFDPTIALRGQ